MCKYFLQAPCTYEIFSISSVSDKLSKNTNSWNGNKDKCILWWTIERNTSRSSSFHLGDFVKNSAGRNAPWPPLREKRFIHFFCNQLAPSHPEKDVQIVSDSFLTSVYKQNCCSGNGYGSVVVAERGAVSRMVIRRARDCKR